MSLAMYWHFPPTPHNCWSAVLQVGKQVVVARSEIRAVRKVVKQRPVEMLQQYSSASSCIRMRIVMEVHYTRCQHSTPLFWMALRSILVFHNTFVTLLWSFAVEFYHQHSFRVSENSCHQIPGRQRLFKLFRLVWWIKSTALTALWFQHSQMKPRFNHLLFVRYDWEIKSHLCGLAQKVKTEAILCVLCAPVSIFETHLAQNVWA
jgi:hypothetical protein